MLSKKDLKLIEELMERIARQVIDDGFEKQAVMISNAFLHEREYYEDKFKQADGRMDRVESKVDNLEDKVDKLENKVDRIESKVDRALRREYVHVEGRVTYLEGKTGYKKPR